MGRERIDSRCAHPAERSGTGWGELEQPRLRPGSAGPWYLRVRPEAGGSPGVGFEQEDRPIVTAIRPQQRLVQCWSTRRGSAQRRWNGFTDRPPRGPGAVRVSVMGGASRLSLLCGRNLENVAGDGGGRRVPVQMAGRARRAIH